MSGKNLYFTPIDTMQVSDWVENSPNNATAMAMYELLFICGCLFVAAIFDDGMGVLFFGVGFTSILLMLALDIAILFTGKR